MEDEIIGQQNKGVFSNIDPRTNIKGFLVVLIAAMLVLAMISYAVVGSNQQNSGKSQKTTTQKDFKPVADRTVVYGYWVGDNQTYIDGVDLKTGKIYNIAKLPVNIKKVSVTSPQTLLFINNTDIRDHGTEISSYDTSTKLMTSVVSAAPGFGIDDYVLSPNKKYIALWEVSIPQDKALDSGVSRVYTVNLDNPQVKNLIYNENLPETLVAHYPVAVTESGEVFMDTFKPNSGAGWANGMSYASFDGSTKALIEEMRSGTYGTQPKMSPDGKMLVFGGFNGTAEEGNAEVNGFRKALISPNTIEVFDLTSKTRRKLPGISEENIYPSVFWDSQRSVVLYSQLPKGSYLLEQYSYDLSSSLPTEIVIPSAENRYSVITSLDSKYLVGVYSEGSTSLGNLGDTYSQMVSQLSVLGNGKNTLLDTTQTLVQYIETLPSGYFAGEGKAGSIIAADNNQNQLQLQTFTLKPKLDPIRQDLQSNSPEVGCENLEEGCITPTIVPDQPTVTPIPPRPLCVDLTREWCNQQLGTNYDRGTNIDPESEFGVCYYQEAKKNVVGCADSPLYLYGDEGMEVNVYIGTQISNSNAPYSNGYSGILTGNGGILIGDKNYSSLEYDYTTAIKKLPRLNYGKTVKAGDVENLIKEYGIKLGLNSKEISDTIKSLKGKLNKEYVFVSFYDDKTSKVILPISFDPQPNVYRNIIFYLKQLDKPIFSKSPVFEKYPERTGFTAVEVSSIVD